MLSIRADSQTVKVQQQILEIEGSMQPFYREIPKWEGKEGETAEKTAAFLKE